MPVSDHEIYQHRMIERMQFPSLIQPRDHCQLHYISSTAVPAHTIYRNYLRSHSYWAVGGVYRLAVASGRNHVQSIQIV